MVSLQDHSETENKSLGHGVFTTCCNDLLGVNHKMVRLMVVIFELA